MKDTILPSSILDIDCGVSCDKGKILNYKTGKCELCQENTYSLGGSFRVNGRHKEWTNENLDKFGNKCSFINVNKLKEIKHECPIFEINGENSSISAGNVNENEKNNTYFYELTYRVNVKKPGKVKEV